jgi:hypothetical protein
MIGLIDRLAGWWLNWRRDWEIRHNPELREVMVHRLDLDQGQLNAVMEHPAVAYLAEEAIDLLKAVGAENYFEMDLMPRIDRGMQQIRVTIQWANKLSPVQKNIKLEAEKARLIEICSALVDYRDRAGSMGFQLEKADDFINAMRAELPELTP